MLGYGLLIMAVTLTAYFLIPIVDGHASSWNEIVFSLSPQSDMPDIVSKAQTSAFSVLAISQLFHMFGMTSIRKTVFHNFKNKNWLLWLAFGLGLGLQFAVVMVPGVNTFFKTTALDFNHWMLVLGLSIAPIVVHEIVALILFIIRKVKEGKVVSPKVKKRKATR